MADVHDIATRSYNMSKIKGKDTKPEMLLRKYLHSKGLRYRLHNKNLPGKPDVILKKYRTVIFVNGCFWHGHKGCKYFVIPKTRTRWWIEKIEETKKRDSKSIRDLKELGWNPMIVWECELKPEKRNDTLEKTYFAIIKEDKY
ncbi:MAG: DNA mismatch endonuclease Vsr [Cryomorphaceae bacterium]|nr:DNA mismatch endonuclease Vsr [Cryomorphaceae bacterium]